MQVNIDTAPAIPAEQQWPGNPRVTHHSIGQTQQHNGRCRWAEVPPIRPPQLVARCAWFVAYDPKFLIVICHRRAEIDAQSIDRPTMALTALLNEERQSGSSLGRFSWPLTLFRVEFPEVEVSPKVDLSVLTCRKSHLPGLNLSGANLTNATWTNGSKCKDPSISQCNL